MLKKFFTWHHFPFWFFHLPTVPYIIWLSLKARSPFFYGACNPIIHHNGGGDRPSKTFVLRQLDPAYLPRTVRVAPSTARADLERLCAEAGLAPPLMVKPDKGERGSLVVRVTDFDQLENAVRTHRESVLLQEWVDTAYEYGVLYERMPGAAHGRITSISVKTLLSVEGDGRQNVGALSRAQAGHARFRAKIDALPGDLLQRVPAAGEHVILDHVAQQAHGARFWDANTLITPEVTAFFDQLCAPLDGFYLGRFDLKATGPESLATGEGLVVLELNGTASVPLHVFDPAVGFLDTYKAMYRHWAAIYRISVANHQRGVAYLRPRDAVRYLFKRFEKRNADVGVS
ncbi:hypothetical protein [Acanthopleuribacter pedis]|uniref:ATP-grasp domain-containing protein n=1 Tax=Acanthopleuribacter pedis TaxID=442870 RepID=A0A8J7Q5F5_9BACT|nr:hypothetical protein [Acanthopleuribacter pedis]MBO1320752.1 hypothetical protein [Acanthopleuribacter pedis]